MAEPGQAFRTLRQRFEHGMFIREYPGESSGSCIVYLHGLGESGLCFERLVLHPRLRGRAQLVPDLPGYGRSLWPAPPQGLDELIEQLHEWLEAQGITRPILVGHSLGGVLALLFAETYPDGVAGVIDVEGNKSFEDCTFSGEAARHEEAAFAEREFARLQDLIYRAGAKDAALRGYYASLRLADPRAIHRHSRELLALSRTESLAERLRRLPVPKLFIAGVPRGISDRSLHLLAQAGVPTALIRGAGHWPFIDQPRRFLELLLDFLDEVDREQSP
jgi:pimeloyl-ACP methyl ester carboxylesterase